MAPPSDICPIYCEIKVKPVCVFVHSNPLPASGEPSASLRTQRLAAFPVRLLSSMAEARRDATTGAKKPRVRSGLTIQLFLPLAKPGEGFRSIAFETLSLGQAPRKACDVSTGPCRLSDYSNCHRLLRFVILLLIVFRLPSKDRHPNINHQPNVTGCQSSDVTGCQSSDVTGCQSSDVAGCQFSDVAGCQFSDVAGCQSSEVAGCQSSDVAGRQSSDVAGCQCSHKKLARKRAYTQESVHTSERTHTK